MNLIHPLHLFTDECPDPCHHCTFYNYYHDHDNRDNNDHDHDNRD
jgi:hypothetical protein